ncbi:putative Rho-type GTPase-activating protein 2 [Leucoagaricus sp. SymC.cos]|nr:putative Rho-type GTPase-activating protein 2 [Leucoagaricus sp. SymC.cos]
MQASSGPTRSFTSPSNSQSSIPSLSSSQAVTVAALLKQHDAASDPKMAALDQAVNERNILSAQNTQLWKLIEKQRSGYNHILKELERIRAERDSYKQKVLALGGNIDKRAKPSDRTTRPSIDAPDNPQNPRYLASRAQSDDNATPRLHSSRSYEPLSHRSNDSMLQGNASTSSSRSQSPSPSKSQKPTPTPLVVPQRSDSQSAPISASASSVASPDDLYQSTRPLQYRKGSITESVSSVSSATNPTPVITTTQYTTTQSQQILGPASPPVQITMSPATPQASSGLQAQAPSSSLSAIPETRPFIPAADPRSSRITLPDEASRYIVNMVDSPVPSPKLDASFTVVTSKPKVSSSLTSEAVREEEFLDMGDDDEEEEIGGQVPPGTHHSLINNTSVLSASSSTQHTQPGYQPPTAAPAHPTHSQHHQQHQPSHQQQQLPANTELNYSSGSLPPYSPQMQSTPTPLHVPPPPRLDSRPHSEKQPNPADISSTTLSSLSSLPDPMQNQRQQQPKEQYRALPLLSSDLPTTIVSVSHSFVRPNDKGKEVLSFVIAVNPGNGGKDPWKVEKMYSDVVLLDSRVRASVGKNMGKKIVTLPEGKLWRDHAPAKVDQRKAVLEQYLQSLVKLPVKNNDGVIAFLTSDIVRETRQPVMQAGHKEGYLTKRGKNFGGWKTRYFVLSGPVLEYYESRGGTHLGSITITGAQIGRQQRTDHRNQSSQSHHDGNDEKEYRHAFLIVEAKKGPGGSHPRHVLCAESDEERDAWVEMLVRYFTGTYSEEPLNYVKSLEPSPIDPSIPTHFPVAQQSIGGTSNSNISARRIIDRLAGLPSSLPDSSSSPLSAVASSGANNFAAGAGLERPNSEMGHYATESPEKRKNAAQSPERHRNDGRKSYHPNGSSSTTSASTLISGPDIAAVQERSTSPSKLNAGGGSKPKISGPIGGKPIPSGFNFGGGKDRDKDKEKDDSGSGGGGGSGSGNSGSERREKARSRFWPGWNKTPAGEKQPVVVVPRAVFGVSLEESLDIAQICNLPAIVFRSIEYLEAQKADQEEGIYRLSGSSAVIKSLKDRFNAEGDVNLLASDDYWDPHAIAGLLKTYLRELPASILTRDLHFRFLSVIDFVDAQERIRELSQLIALLPLANYSLLRALTAHLILIVQNASTNKMTMRNVGIVFSPTLGIPAGVFSLMLGEFNRVFNVDAGREHLNENDSGGREEGQSAEGDDVLRRNSRQYSDAAADQVLGLAGRSLKTSADDLQSDTDEYSVQDESSTETTGDGEMTAESVLAAGSGSVRDGGDSYHLQQQQQQQAQQPTAIRISPPDTPRLSKAAHTASSKGLNVNTSTSFGTPTRGMNRFSRGPGAMGLPTSPRPPHSPSRPVDTVAPSVE